MKKFAGNRAEVVAMNQFILLSAAIHSTALTLFRAKQ